MNRQRSFIWNFNRVVPAAGMAVLLCVTTQLQGQQIQVSTPFTTVNDSFFENTGVNFGFTIPGGRGPGSRIVGLTEAGIMPNIMFNQGSAASAIPQFGGFDPNASARFGFRTIGRGGGGISLGMNFGKGSNRSIVSTTPSIVVQNGFGGTLTNGSFNPFVTGVTPIVGGGNIVSPIDNGVTRALRSGQLDLTKPTPDAEEKSYELPRTYSNPNSTAQSGDISVAAIKAQREAESLAKEQRLATLIEQAQKHESEESYREARIAYRAAIRECEDGSLKKELRSRLKHLSGR